MTLELLDRKDAADFLELSTRTLDRYIARKTFSIKRKAGKVFLVKEELDAWKNQKDPAVAHVVSEGQEIQISGENSSKYQILYQEAKEELAKKDALLRQMHYQLGVLETEAKQSVPLLEAQQNHRELEEEIEKLEGERARLVASLTATHRGRMIFFFFAFCFFLLSVSLLFGILTPGQIL
ncbi:MAG: hypothetical protein WCJ84_03115 [Candidatus Peregrinibacteria bacterium]